MENWTHSHWQEQVQRPQSRGDSALRITATREFCHVTRGTSSRIYISGCRGGKRMSSHFTGQRDAEQGTRPVTSSPPSPRHSHQDRTTFRKLEGNHTSCSPLSISGVHFVRSSCPLPRRDRSGLIQYQCSWFSTDRSEKVVQNWMHLCKCFVIKWKHSKNSNDPCEILIIT